MTRRQLKPTDKRTITVTLTTSYTSYGTTHVSPVTIDALDGEYGNVKVDDLIASLHALKDKYPGRVLSLEHEVYFEPYEERASRRWLVRETRLETDEDVAARIAKDKANDAAIAARELAEYERLKAKLGG